MTNTTQVSISPALIEEVMNLLPKDLSENQRQIEAQPWIQEILGNARRFIEKFQHTNFFQKDSHHEFTGITLYDHMNRVTHRFSYIMRCIGNTLELYPLKDIVMDEFYPVRKVIAESAFPEYSQDLWPSFYERR